MPIELPHYTDRQLVCGSRTEEDELFVWGALDLLRPILKPCLLINGGANGVDLLAHRWAKTRGIPSCTLDAQWNYYGRLQAGPLRNKWMLELLSPNVVVAFPGGPGTADMVRRARDANILVIFVLRQGGFYIRGQHVGQQGDLGGQFRRRSGGQGDQVWQ